MATAFRVLAALLVVGLLAGIGVSVYNAGVSQGLAQNVTTAASGAPAVVYGYPAYYGHWGFGFGFFGIFFWILGIFLIFALLRAAFGWGRWGRGRWGGYGAGGGPEALIRSRTDRPDLVVLDLGLPGLDGFDVTRQLRRDSSVPIIMLSSRDAGSDTVVGVELGAWERD